MKIKYKLIVLINENPGITLNKITEILLLTKGNISIHLKSLESLELIKKYITNEKQLKIHPTKKCKDIYLQRKKEELRSFYKKKVTNSSNIKNI